MTVTNITATTATVHWCESVHVDTAAVVYTYTATANPHSSIIPWLFGGGHSAACILTGPDSGSLSCTISGLLSNVPYVVSVKVCDPTNFCSLPSYPIDFTTLPSAPTNVWALDWTATSVNVLWIPSNEDGVTEDYYYTARARYLGVTVATCLATAETAHCSVRGLQPDTNYSLTVEACTAADFCSSPSAAVTGKTMLAAPTHIHVSDRTSSSVNVSWTPSRGANDTGSVSSVHFIVTAADGDRMFNCTSLDEAHCILTGLHPDTVYNITVAACSVSTGECTLSSVEPIEIRTRPAAPTHIHVSDRTSSSVNVSWTPSRGANDTGSASSVHFIVTAADGDRMFNCTSLDEAHCILTGLHPDTVYNITVAACSVSTGECTLSSVEPIEIRTRPAAPTHIHVSDRTSSSVNVSWTPSRGANDTGSASSVHFIVTAADGDRMFNCTSLDEAHCILTGLHPDTVYNITVAACSVSTGECTLSSVEPIEIRTRPAAPTHIHVSDRTSSSVNVSWTPSRGANDTGSASSVHFIVTAADGDRMFNCTSLDEAHCILTGLHPDTVYNITVAACSVSTGECTLSSVEPIEIRTRPAAPTHIHVSDRTSSSVNVSWTPSRGANDTGSASSVHFIVTAADGDRMFNCTSLDEAHCILTGLHPDTVYNITVAACSVSTGECTLSSVEPIEIRTRPAAPTHIHVSDRTSSSVNVSWTPSRGANDTGSASSVHFIVTAADGDRMFNCTSLDEAHCILTGLHPDTVYNITVAACSVSTGECTLSSVEPIEIRTRPAAPTHIHVSDRTSSSVNVSWTPSRGANDTGSASSVHFIVTAADGDRMFNCTSLDEAHCILTGLHPDTVYNITVAACSVSTGECTLSSVEPIEIRTRPAEPGLVSVTNITTHGLVVSVMRVLEDTNRLFTYLSTATSVIREANLTEVHTCKTMNKDVMATCTFTTLSPNSLYNVTVQTCVSVGFCDPPMWSILLYTLPTAPRNVTVFNVTTQTAIIHWTQSSEDVSRLYEYVADARPMAGPNATSRTCVATGATECSIKRLSADRFYTVTVTAHAPSGRLSSPSLPTSFVTPPEAPHLSAVDEIGMNSVRISWQQMPGGPYMGVVTLQPQSGVLGGPHSCSLNSSAASASCIVMNLQPDSAYSATVKICSTTSLCSGPSDRVCVRTLFESTLLNFDILGPNNITANWKEETPHPTPRGGPSEVLSVSDIDANAVEATINNASSAFTYFAVVSPDPAFSYSPFHNMSKRCKLFNVAGKLSCRTEYLHPNTIHVLGLQKCNLTEGDCTLHDRMASARTLPEAPQGVNVGAIGKTTLSVTFQDAAIPGGALVAVATPFNANATSGIGVKNCSLQANANETSCLITGLESGTRYTIFALSCAPAQGSFPVTCSKPSPSKQAVTMSEGGLPIAIIVLGVLAGVLVLLVALIIFCFCRRRLRRSDSIEVIEEPEPKRAAAPM
ncbi:hypothetical protein SprV_0802602400 [Sparganum proliferum]